MGCIAGIKASGATSCRQQMAINWAVVRRMHAYFVWAITVALLWMPASRAMADGEEISEAEFAALPDYCRARLKAPRTSPEWVRWASALPEFNSVHHYCVGLAFLNRATYAPHLRGRYLHRAVNEMSYNLKSPRPGGALTATMFLNRAVAYEMLKSPGEATRDLMSAIEHDRRLVPAYERLADLLVGRNDRLGALETVTEGLRRVPESERLQAKYLELGGRKPFPAPIESPAPAGGGDGGGVATGGGDAGVASAVVRTELDPEAARSAAPDASAETGASGKDDGRSCRFCAVDELDRPSKAQGPGRSCRFCADIE